jgi:hypothetical protein
VNENSDFVVEFVASAIVCGLLAVISTTMRAAPILTILLASVALAGTTLSIAAFIGRKAPSLRWRRRFLAAGVIVGGFLTLGVMYWFVGYCNC